MSFLTDPALDKETKRIHPLAVWNVFFPHEEEAFSNVAINKQVGHRKYGNILVCYLTIICCKKKLVKLQCDKKEYHKGRNGIT